MQFIYVDPAWECMMGYRAVDVMGKATHDFFTCTTCALIEAISLNIKEVCVLLAAVKRSLSLLLHHAMPYRLCLVFFPSPI